MDPDELRTRLLLANHFKEGDLPLGGTRDDRVREDARRALLATRLADIRRATLVDDGVSDTLERARDRRFDHELDPLTVEDFSRILLSPGAASWLRPRCDGLSSEAIAAAAKVMSDAELSRVAHAIFNPLPGGGVTIGSPRHFGSRIQPNSPGDDEEEILLSILEGLTYGCGDVILGVNPASNDLDTIVELEELLDRIVHRLELPTKCCVLSDLVKQHQARARTRVQVGFQSLAGTSSALAGMVGLDVDGLLDLARSFEGLYFETGQGSAVTNGAAEGIDMVTLESRAYGMARHLGRETRAWMIVNDVAGFIGPEVFRTAGQLERACLEDVVMGKLHGLTMGLDVCATFHMGIAPGMLQAVTERIVERAAPAYLMAVPGNADPMLGYLTTSFRDHPRLRRRYGRHATSEMRKRLEDLGVASPDAPAAPTGRSTAMLYAAYAKAGGDERSAAALADEGRRKVGDVRERGYDLGDGCGPDYSAPPDVERRLGAIYDNARHALYATLAGSVIEHACPRSVRVRTKAVDREDYLMHPPHGERLRDEDARAVGRLYPQRRPQVQIVVSDGLNAHALNEHLHALVPPLRQLLAQAGVRVGEVDVIIGNGRVRAGYHVGASIDPLAIVHFIGERPGTGLNTVSAYLTYGRDAAGKSRWRPDLDHSCTTAVCGIHPRGTPPALAVREIARIVARMLEQRRSGVALEDVR
jgi:ethanolamine ammonia-lyase large subunit